MWELFDTGDSQKRILASNNSDQSNTLRSYDFFFFWKMSNNVIFKKVVDFQIVTANSMSREFFYKM